MIIFSPDSNHTPPFIETPHRVKIGYKPIPKFASLKTAFGESRVSRLFDGRTFVPHASCVGISERACERVCLILPQPKSGDRWSGEEIIALGQAESLHSEHAPKGYRPATARELYHYAKIHPVQQLVALGSTAYLDGGRYAAAFTSVQSRAAGGQKAALAHRYVREMTRNGEYYLFIAI